VKTVTATRGKTDLGIYLSWIFVQTITFEGVGGEGERQNVRM
jgi:hypothetical protein